MEEENGFSRLLSQYRLPLAMGLIGAVLLLSEVVSSGLISKTFVKSTATPIKSDQVPSGSLATPTKVAVDVSGAVQKPGVYYLSGSSRIEEAIIAAGGVSKEADPLYLSRSLNLAAKVTDGMKVYVPSSGETVVSSVVLGAAQTGAPAIVSINGSTQAELESLPGIGEVTAQKIISGRPYNSVEELLTKKVLGRSVYDKIKDKVGL